MQIAYTGKKLKSEFKFKDSRNFEQTHHVIIEAVCPNDNCKKSYIGETDKRLRARAKEHPSEISHLRQHTIRTGHRPVTLNDFKFNLQAFVCKEIER